MITRAKLSAQYADVKGTLDQALAGGGGTVAFPSKPKATQFHHRCNIFRKKWRDADLSASVYDLLQIRRPTDEGVLEFVKLEPPTGFVPASTEAVEIPAAVEDDEMMDAALAASQRIFGDDHD